MVRPADVEEASSGPPEAVAVLNARRKAAAVEGTRVLGVDTIVSLDGRLYGKPRDADEARATLEALSGRRHQVVSGLVLDGRASAVTTDVTFREIEEPLLDWYLAAGEWRGRAGGYAIQGRGALLVREIHGDYLNVVGLPVQALFELVQG